MYIQKYASHSTVFEFDRTYFYTRPTTKRSDERPYGQMHWSPIADTGLTTLA